MFRHPRRWHWFWNKHKCTYKPPHTHTCWCCRMPPLSLWTLQVSRARPSLLQSHKHGENAPLGHEWSRLQGFGCWHLHQAMKSMLQKHVNPENSSACPKRCPWLSPNFFSLPRVYQNRQIYKCQLTPIALQPLLVLATRQPSVVAIGTWNSFSSRHRGPATPTGMGI